MIYVKQSSNEEKMRVKPLTRKIAESARNDEDEKVKPKDKYLQRKFFYEDETLIEQVFKRPPSTPQKEKKSVKMS